MAEQEVIKHSYVNRKIRLFDYIQDNDKRISNITEVLNSEQAHNICGSLTFTNEITERYDMTLQRMQKIILMINKEYGLTD